MSVNLNLVGGFHLLSALGGDNVIDQLSGFQGNLGFLGQLGDSFSFTAGMNLNFSASSLANTIQSGGIPGAGFMPPPSLFGCPCEHMYAAPRGFDFGASAPGSNFFEQIMNRQQGGNLERFLGKNQFARQQVEMMLGGRVIPDGSNDGRIFVQPFPPGHFPGGGAMNQSANSALDMLNGLHRATTGLGLSEASSLFPTMMMGALGQMLGGGQVASPFNFAGGSTGAHQTGTDGQYQDQFGISGGDEISNVLNDSSLTVEDKVTLMIMMIMKKMDEDIEKQANYVNKLQQQQSEESSGGGGKGGKGSSSSGDSDSSPSIDVETMKLKRLIDKRSQMFDMLRQIIDKYNQTAKGIIDSMGR